MLQDRTIEFKNFIIPEDASDEEKAAFADIQSITLYFDSIYKIVEHENRTEVFHMEPFSPFSPNLTHTSAMVIPVKETKEEIMKMIDEKLEIIKQKKKESENQSNLIKKAPSNWK